MNVCHACAPAENEIDKDDPRLGAHNVGFRGYRIFDCIAILKEEISKYQNGKRQSFSDKEHLQSLITQVDHLSVLVNNLPSLCHYASSRFIEKGQMKGWCGTAFSLLICSEGAPAQWKHVDTRDPAYQFVFGLSCCDLGKALVSLNLCDQQLKLAFHHHSSTTNTYIVW